MFVGRNIMNRGRIFIRILGREENLYPRLKQIHYYMILYLHHESIDFIAEPYIYIYIYIICVICIICIKHF